MSQYLTTNRITQSLVKITSRPVSSSKSPSFHHSRRRSNHLSLSFDFDDLEGFWRRRAGIVNSALRAMLARGDLLFHSLISLVISSTNNFPTAPPETLKRFFLHFAVPLSSLYELATRLVSYADSIFALVQSGLVV